MSSPDRRDAERRRHEAELAANATEQTCRKLRRDALAWLHGKGRLRDEQLQAGQEVLRVWSAITSHLFARVARLDRAPGSSAMDDWPPSLKRAYQERYAPWRDEVSLYRVAGNHTRADLVLFVAVDNMGIRQAADRIEVHHRVALRELQAGLHRYAEIAGWVRESPTPNLPFRAAQFGA